MNEHDLDWEEGYRAGIQHSLMTIMTMSREPKKLWYHLAELYTDSEERTDRMLGKMLQKEEGGEYGSHQGRTQR